MFDYMCGRTLTTLQIMLSNNAAFVYFNITHTWTYAYRKILHEKIVCIVLY
jgi:hypothetical protein